MKNLVYIFLFGILPLAGCQSEEGNKLLIATAANVQFAMEDLVEAFSEETGIEAEIIYGSSGKLTAQIKEGAPFDVFVSANMKYPEELYRSGFTTFAPEVYAYGSLVLWTVEENLPVELEVLADPDVAHIAIANPKNAPYGTAAIEAMKFYGLYNLVEDKLVYGESISQTNQFILSRTALLGFTAKSVVLSPKLKGKGRWKDVPEESYAPIEQGVVIIKKEEKEVADAEEFYSFLFTDKAQKILRDYGYSTDQRIDEQL